jgi:hypothetical protein
MGERKKETYREYFKYFAVDFAIFAQKKSTRKCNIFAKIFSAIELHVDLAGKEDFRCI